MRPWCHPFVIAGLCVTQVAGCATPYQAHGFQGGFQEVRVADTDDEFWLSFDGNVPLDAKTLEQSLLRRAAELTLRHGFTHFLVLGRSRQAGFGFTLRPGIIGPSRQTTSVLHIKCLMGDAGERGAIAAGQFLDSLKTPGDSEPPPPSTPRTL